MKRWNITRDRIFELTLEVTYRHSYGHTPATELDPEENTDDREIESVLLEGRPLPPKAVDALEEFLQRFIDEDEPEPDDQDRDYDDPEK